MMRVLAVIAIILTFDGIFGQQSSPVDGILGQQSSPVDGIPLCEPNPLWPEGQRDFVFGFENVSSYFPLQSLYGEALVPTVQGFRDPTKVPSTFYYLWCGAKPFTFQHYLSVMSVIRFMRPDNIYFYYEELPEIDENFYNTWLDELQKGYPFFILVQRLSRADCKFKDTYSRPQTSLILKTLAEQGGVFMSELAILTKPLDLNQHLTVRLDNRQAGFIVAAPRITAGQSDNWLYQLSTSKCPGVSMITEKVLDRHEVFYDTPDDVLQQIEKDVCMQIEGRYYPRDFWTRDDVLGSHVRKIFYGSPEIRQAEPHPVTVVPNIAHMIWVGGGAEDEMQMSFLFFLSVLSLVYIQKVEGVYIHGDSPPTGAYWDLVSQIPQVTFRYRNFQGMQIYGIPLGQGCHSWKASHWSDVIRADIMLRWGGIYIDTDALLVRPINPELLRYDTVSHFSFARRLPYPDSFVAGFLLAKPGAEFFQRFQETMKRYDDGHWLYSALLAPYKVIERYPHTVHIEPRLQVVCLFEKCHPTWVHNYKNMTLHHANTGSLPDWKTDANVYHFCSNTTPEHLMNASALARAPVDSMFAQMGRYILDMSPDQFNVLSGGNQ